MCFPSPYFTPKLFCFFCLRLLNCLFAVSINLLVEFSFIILECPVLLVLFDPVPVPFECSLIHQYILNNFFQSHCQTSLQFSFCGLLFPVCFTFLLLFHLFRSFIICPNFISHPGFLFLFGFLGRYLFYKWLILLLHWLTLVRSYCLLGYVNFQPQTCLFSVLIPWGCNEVSYLLMIFIINSTFVQSLVIVLVIFWGSVVI